MISQKATGRSKSMPLGVCSGVGLSLAVLSAMLALLSGMILKGVIHEARIGYGIMVSLMLASCIGTSTAIFLVKRRKWMVSILTGGGMLTLLALLSVILLGGKLEGIPASGAVIFGGSVLAALMQKDGNPARTKRHRLRRR